MSDVRPQVARSAKPSSNLVGQSSSRRAALALQQPGRPRQLARAWRTGAASIPATSR